MPQVSTAIVAIQNCIGISLLTVCEANRESRDKKGESRETPAKSTV